MDEWKLAQGDPADELARLHYFSIKKHQDGREIEFVIIVREYVQPTGEPPKRFFAQADKQTNQKTAPFTPCGWGPTLLKALTECIRSVHEFPYEGPDVS